MGIKRAEILLDEFETPFRVIQAITESEITLDTAGKIRKCNSALNQIKGIGKKFIEQNLALLTNPF